jgi:hypothetical protein
MFYMSKSVPDSKANIEEKKLDLLERVSRHLDEAPEIRRREEIIDRVRSHWNRSVSPDSGQVRSDDFPVALYEVECAGGMRRSFKPQLGKCQWPIFIISIPKSGTYLIGAILEQLGMISTGVHLWETGFHDYRNHTIQEMVERYQEFANNSPLEKSVGFILPGQFAPGHLCYSRPNLALLSGFKCLFAYRELRACMISHMRWYERPGRGSPKYTAWRQEKEPHLRMERFLHFYTPTLMSFYRYICGWKKHRMPLAVCFETLCGDCGAEAQLGLVRKMGAHVGVELSDAAAQALLLAVMGRETKTWSGGRSVVEDYWNDNCEKIFEAAGGVELDRFLGYEK